MLKHSESLTDKEKVKLDLYKILRMSVLLSQGEVDELTLSKFKSASLNLDKMNTESYEEELVGMFYDTNTLEEEELRLKKLVEFIKSRLEERKSLENDYKNVTNRDLEDLEYIEKSGDIDLYEKRLNLIKNYLDNSKTIEVNKKELKYLEEQLSNEFDLKESNEEKNLNFEDKLYTDFVNILYELELDYFTKLTDTEEELNKISKEIMESKDQKDTFVTAFDNLKSSGISGDLELEYASYVENSKRNYYFVKEKEILLKIYELLNRKEKEYSNLFSKRENVNELLNERLDLRKEMNIKEKDLLLPIYELTKEQSREIEKEKSNTDNINVLTERIKLKENRLEELNREVKKPEVLSLLKEFKMIDTYDHDDEELNKEYLFEDEIVNEDTENEEVNDEEIKEDILADLLKEEENSLEKLEETEDEEKEEEQEQEEQEEIFLPNQIKSSEKIMSMNFGLSRLKSISVMKRVADMLGIDTKKDSFKKKEEVKEDIKDTSVVNNEESKVENNSDTTNSNSNNDLFWTKAEFDNMNEEVKKETKEENIVNNSNTSVKEEIKQDDIFENNNSIFENNLNTNKEDIFNSNQNTFENNDNKEIFNNNNNIFESNNNVVFPDVVMPTIEEKKLPVDNDSDKFKWPDDSNLEKFDLNGIFPN